MSVGLTRRPLARLGAAACLCGLLAVVPQGHGKGITLRLAAEPASPRTGELVRISLRGELEEGVQGPCRRTRIVVVAPGVSVRAALRSLEGGTAPRRIGEWDAFRLASLRSTAELTWRGRLRPNRPGRWTLVVPNWCAAGYVLPEGAERLYVEVGE